MGDPSGDRLSPRFSGYREEALAALANGDWYGTYRWTKAWISIGGGARSVEPWLLHVAGSLVQGHKREAVLPTDTALETWISDPRARAVLHYVRGEIVRRHARDPKCARADLEAAVAAAPSWLAEAAREALRTCEQEAAASRKRRPSVGPTPAYDGREAGSAGRTPPEALSVAEPPAVWEAFHDVLTSPDPTARAASWSGAESWEAQRPASRRPSATA